MLGDTVWLLFARDLTEFANTSLFLRNLVLLTYLYLMPLLVFQKHKTMAGSMIAHYLTVTVYLERTWHLFFKFILGTRD
jgi:hypothetical protein